MSRLPESREEDDSTMRLAGAAAGLLAGLFVGILTGALLVAAGSEVLAGWALFTATVAGAVAGYLSASVGLGLAEGVLHFIAGVVHEVSERLPSPREQVPWWLRGPFVAGVLVGLLILITRRW